MDQAEKLVHSTYAQMTEAALLKALASPEQTARKLQVQKLFREFAKNQGKSTLILPLIMSSAQQALK